MTGFCSCLIHQAQLPNKLGTYIFKLRLATATKLGIAELVPSETRNLMLQFASATPRNRCRSSQ